jgi:hypothetical protein
LLEKEKKHSNNMHYFIDVNLSMLETEGRIHSNEHGRFAGRMSTVGRRGGTIRFIDRPGAEIVTRVQEM